MFIGLCPSLAVLFLVQGEIIFEPVGSIILDQAVGFPPTV